MKNYLSICPRQKDLPAVDCRKTVNTSQKAFQADKEDSGLQSLSMTNTLPLGPGQYDIHERFQVGGFGSFD